jgi:hypothetical protein
MGRALHWVLCIAGALALIEGGLEAALVLLAGGGALQAAVSGLLSAALSVVWIACLVPLLLLVAAAGERLARQHRGTLLGSGLLALVSVAPALAISDPTNRSAALPYVAIAVVAALLVAAAGFMAHAEPRRDNMIGAALLGVAAVALDVFVGADMYPEAHGLCLLVLTSAVAALLADVALRRPAPPLRVLLALGVAATLGCGAFVVALSRLHPEVYSLPVLHGRNVARLTSWLRGPFDRDGDGASPVLWGGDCDDTNPRIYPGAPDPPGGGDQNCNGVDGQLRAPDSFFTSAKLGPAMLASGAVDRVVLLTLDTFRPELLREDVMPNLWALTRHGARFERSYASATVTLASVPLLHRPALGEPSVAELFEKAGVDSHAYGLGSGFRHNQQGADPLVVERTLKVLREHGATPTFVWAHLFGLHAGYVMWPDAKSPPRVRNFAPAYVSEAMHADRLLAPLVAWLTAPERLARTVIILSGDHGEGFGEHGAYAHTRLGWDEMLRVPLVLIAPGLAPGDYPYLASHRDLPATLAGAFGIDPEPAGLERFGRSMLRLIGHERTPLRRAVVSHSSRQSSGATGHGPLAILVDGSDKVVIGIGDGVVERYDLARDPEERHNLAPSSPELTARLVHKLNLYLDAEQWPASVNRRELERLLGPR